MVVNTSRGEIINDFDMNNFLKNKSARYFTDVLNNEIKNKNKSIILKKFRKNSKQILITPHIGGMTEDAQQLAYNGVLEELIRFNKNEKQNV